MALRDIDGCEVVCTRNSREQSVFKYPIFLSRAARLSPKQDCVQPVLLMSWSDWQYVSQPSTTHEGAFGGDHDEFNTSTRVVSSSGCYNPAIHCAGGADQTRWVVIWKFPHDLNNLSGYIPMYDQPVPVGKYSLRRRLGGQA
jgi:hypothetical protein